MDKKKKIFIITGAVLFFAAALLIFDSTLLNKVEQTSQQPNGYESTVGDKGPENSSLSTDETSVATDESNELKEQLLYSEQINVEYNTPEYDMELFVCVINDRNNFLRIRYYKDGASTEDEINVDDIPELAGVFGGSERSQKSEDVFRISQALLNPVYSQLYLLIQKDSMQIYSKSALYRISLNDMSVKQLFSYTGDYSELVFNSDFKMMAYSFEDPPYLSNLQEDSLLEVYDCHNDEYIIKANKDKDHKVLGKNSNEDLLYDYGLVGWDSPAVVRLTQAVRRRAELNTKPVKSEVLYDISKNLLYDRYGAELNEIGDGSAVGDSVGDSSSNGDGSSAGNSDGDGSSNDNGSTDGDGSSGIDGSSTPSENPDNKPKDTEPVATLKEFYRCLNSPEDYSKGMGILDSDFKLKMSMLKQFGVEEIWMRDIDSESASVFSELLKAAKFDIIANEVLNGDIYVITYYHKLSFGAQSDVRQLMSAHLKKIDKDWKIILIEDGIL